MGVAFLFCAILASIVLTVLAVRWFGAARRSNDTPRHEPWRSCWEEVTECADGRRYGRYQCFDTLLAETEQMARQGVFPICYPRD